MKAIISFIIISLIYSIVLSGCRQIFGDGDQPELIIQAPVESSKIIVTAPIQSSIWKPGDVIRIKWSAPSINIIDIKLFRKSSYQFTIQENIENTGSFDWSIPVNINLSNHYLVKVINHNNQDTYQFSGRFAIQ